MKRKQIIRQKFRDDVLNRDDHKCKFCDETQNLDAHHITDRNDMPNGGYVKENGITLCQTHHKLAEIYHQMNGDDWYDGMHPDDLYDLIGSSYNKACEVDELRGND